MTAKAKGALSFSVPGIPRPQGSKSGFVVRGKDGKSHVSMKESSEGVKPWRAVVSLAARQAMIQQNILGAFQKEPIQLCLFFYLPRPKSLPKKITHHRTRPDLDKLCRSVLDALEGVVYRDDGQVQCILAHKNFGTPGVYIECKRL